MPGASTWKNAAISPRNEPIFDRGGQTAADELSSRACQPQSASTPTSVVARSSTIRISSWRSSSRAIALACARTCATSRACLRICAFRRSSRSSGRSHRKGAVPQDIKTPLGSAAKVFEKDFFDLTKEKPIRAHLKRLKKTQIIVAGCETDVCVLQSCLGLLELGFEVFAVEELLFSSARNVDAAVVRLRSAGVTILSYKTLYFELIEAVGGGPHAEKMLASFGEFPDDLPEEAAT